MRGGAELCALADARRTGRLARRVHARTDRVAVSLDGDGDGVMAVVRLKRREESSCSARREDVRAEFTGFERLEPIDAARRRLLALGRGCHDAHVVVAAGRRKRRRRGRRWTCKRVVRVRMQTSIPASVRAVRVTMLGTVARRAHNHPEVTGVHATLADAARTWADAVITLSSVATALIGAGHTRAARPAFVCADTRTLGLHPYS